MGMETNCTEVEQCVAANFTEITNRLAEDESNILLNGEAITQIVTVDLPELHSEIDKAVADFIANDAQLQVNIDLEIDLRTQKDTELEAKINEEMNFRAERDDLLQKSIDNEASERIKQDNALESKIDAETNERTQQTDRLGQKDIELQNQIEAINYTPRFSAKIASAAAFYMPKGYITNFIEFVDVGDDFDPSFGTFTVSQAGTYVFHFSGLKFSGNVGAIYFAINNQIAQNTLESDTQAFPLNGLVTVYLNVGDVVALYNQYGVSIYVHAIDPFTFHGYLVA